jgi:hypothetical protein
MAIRLARLYTGDGGESHLTDGQVALEPPDARSAADDAATVTFQESPGDRTCRDTTRPNAST